MRWAVRSRARGLQARSDSAQGLLLRLPRLRLTSSCSLSFSPASLRSLPLDFSSAPLGAVAEGCWDCTGVLSRPPSSIAATTAGLLRAHLLAPPPPLPRLPCASSYRPEVPGGSRVPPSEAGRELLFRHLARATRAGLGCLCTCERSDCGDA